MPSILISENIQGAAVDALAQRFHVTASPQLWRDPEALAAALHEVDGLIIRNQTRITRTLLAGIDKLKVIGRAGVGLDNVDVPACTEAGVLVVSTPEQNAISVAELAIGLMLSLARQIPWADADTKQGCWNRQRFTGVELYGKTLGIVGAGRIGFLTGMRAQAFGMNVLAYDPFVSRDNVYLAEIGARVVALPELLAKADVVSCHLPSTPQTQGIVNADCFAHMKRSAFFINTSRGEVVNEVDLYNALATKRIAGAALDVRQSEPPCTGELEKLPNVLLMPHIAALTTEAQDRVTSSICDDVASVMEGRAPVYPVNRL